MTGRFKPTVILPKLNWHHQHGKALLHGPKFLLYETQTNIRFTTPA